MRASCNTKMNIIVRRGSIRIEYGAPINRTVTGYGDVCIDNKLYIGKRTLRYMDNDEPLPYKLIDKVIKDVANSEYANLVVFDDQ